MRQIKKEKIEEILHRLAAEFVRDEASEASLLTITRVELSSSGREALIYFTTLPTDKEDTALKFLTRKITDFKNYVKEESRLGIIPKMTFMIDYGERNRQRLDELSQENH